MTSTPTTTAAVRVYEHGGPEQLVHGQRPLPALGPTDVLVAVDTAAVSGWDLKYRHGLRPGTKLPGRSPCPMPRQLRREATGTVIAIPGHQGPGAYAEYVVRDERLFLPVPDHVDLEHPGRDRGRWPHGPDHHPTRPALRPARHRHGVDYSTRRDLLPLALDVRLEADIASREKKLLPTLTTVAVARTGEDTFHWERAVLDDPGPGEVLVRLVAAGLCHTDLSVLAGRLPTPLPAVLGHEGAGTVEAVGADVAGIGPGDHVVLSFNSCGHCNACRTGRPATCETYFPLNFGAARADGTTPIRTEDGTPLGGLFFGQSSLARHAVVSAQSVVRVDVADEEELSLLAPVGCGIQTGAGAILNLLKPRYGDSVAVLGAGAVGLSAVMAARLTPARTIVAVDVVPSRLALATELGATHTIDSSKEDLRSRLGDLVGPGGLTYIVETTGVPALLELAATAIAADGTVAVIGAPSAGSRASFDINSLIDGRTIRGVTEGASDRLTFIPALIDLHRQGRLPFDGFIRCYPPDRLDQAVADARSGHTIKPVIRFATSGNLGEK